MDDRVEYRRDGPVAVITINNPPVNALSIGVPQGIIDGVDAGERDLEVEALVLIGAGRGFIAGADIREFNKPRPADAATIRDVIDRFEASSKPVIAAIHGVCFGGGLEVAMACHYRCAVPSARLGQPEVKLGLVPGAGGTQRLPRLVGVEKALDMCVTGDPISAGEAHALGLVDEVVDGDLLEGSRAFARRILDEGGILRRTRGDDSKVKAAAGNSELFEGYRKKIARRARGYLAPWRCIDAVEAATELPIDEGLKKERELFDECLASPQAKALMHVFFAERAAGKVAGIGKDTPTRRVERAGVVGAGTMGGGIAMNFANVGIPVRITDVTQEALDRGLGRIRFNYERSVKSGRFDQAEVERRMALIEPTLDLAEYGDADFVIEAVFEEMDIKKETFRRLDKICKADAVIATNTSYLDVNEIAAETGRPEQVLGTHFFSPANVMRLLEIVRGEATSPETLATTVKLAKVIGKVGVVAGVCHGFVGNRMLEGYLSEANLLVLEGALPQQVDEAITDFGLPMGPYTMGDMAGLDIGWRSRKERGGAEIDRHARISDALCEMGRFGQKTGAGWYRYEEGSRTPIPDPEVEKLVIEISAQLGIARRKIDDEEIIERCIYPMINEGARILEEGIAARASDIDIIWINGYGFPAYRGGPMFYADQVGLRKIHDTICRLRDAHGRAWEPAPLLARLAGEGKGFAEL